MMLGQNQCRNCHNNNKFKSANKHLASGVSSWRCYFLNIMLRKEDSLDVKCGMVVRSIIEHVGPGSYELLQIAPRRHIGDKTTLDAQMSHSHQNSYLENVCWTQPATSSLS